MCPCPRETEAYARNKTRTDAQSSNIFPTANKWERLSCPPTGEWIQHNGDTVVPHSHGILVTRLKCWWYMIQYGWTWKTWCSVKGAPAFEPHIRPHFCAIPTIGKSTETDSNWEGEVMGKLGATTTGNRVSFLGVTAMFWRVVTTAELCHYSKSLISKGCIV